LDPVVGEWAKVAARHCDRFVEFGPKYLDPFLFAVSAADGFAISADELGHDTVGKGGPPAWVTDTMPARVFQGSEVGAERWEGPYFFARSFKLTRTFRVSREPIKEVVIRAQSSCKGQGGLSGRLRVADGPEISAQSDLSVASRFCAHYPRACSEGGGRMGAWFRRWSHKPFDIAPVRLESDLRPGTSVTLEVSAELPPDEACEIILSPVQLRH
jgi:hypothetical protein